MPTAAFSSAHLDALTGTAHLATHDASGVTVVRLREARLDAHVAVDLKRRLASMIDAGLRRLVLDLTDVQFMDSSGLGALVAALKLVGHDGELALAGVHPGVHELFALTRMDRVFQIYVSPEAAAAVLRGAPALA
ncbi:MAG: STAS domain-containing protein [Bacteroidota bacterium]